MMKVCLLLSLVLLASASSSDSDKPNPVLKVVKMLEDMAAQLKAEAKGDEEAYDKMQCYCVSNEAEKSKAISDANLAIEELKNLIEQNTAKSSTLTSEIAGLKDEIAANTESLATSTEMRAKDSAEFNEVEKNAIVSIGGLKTAVMVLGNANDYSLLQVKAALKAVPLNKVSAKQQLAIESIMNANTPSFLQVNSKTKAPASGEIFGIMKQMKEEFEGNLATAKKDEATAVSDFNGLKAGKNEEIQAAQEKVTTKEAENGEAVEIAATSKTDLADTEEQLAADSEFLANLQEMCGNLDKEFAARTQARATEQAGVSEAIGILTDDDAHDLFGKSLGFMQFGMHVKRASLRELASAKVAMAAKKANSKQLARLAVTMKLADFSMVKEKVQNMINDLAAQKKEEIATKDQCNTDLYENTKATTARKGEAEDLENDVANLEDAKANLGDEVKALEAATAAMHIDVKRASENREEESKEFQTTVADQRATQTILTKALDRLKEVYGKKGGAALIQSMIKHTHKQNPGSFTTYKKNESAGGVLAMIEKVIEDSKALEADAIAGEKDARAAYETFVNDSTTSLNAMAKSIAQKTAEAGTTDESLVIAKEDLKAANTDIESLEGMDKQLHWDCDFLLQNFNTRQTSLDGEIEALESSIAMLSGARF